MRKSSTYKNLLAQVYSSIDLIDRTFTKYNIEHDETSCTAA